MRGSSGRVTKGASVTFRLEVQQRNDLDQIRGAKSLAKFVREAVAEKVQRERLTRSA